MLCLANSYKHGGRCIAGIEVTLDNKGYSIVRDVNGVPKWVRPVFPIVLLVKFRTRMP